MINEEKSVVFDRVMILRGNLFLPIGLMFVQVVYLMQKRWRIPHLTMHIA